MYNKKKRNFMLAGGLGNQFFQLAAAIDLGKNSTIELNAFLGNCRLNSTGNPELSSFVLPRQVVISNRVYGKYVIKFTSAILSLGLDRGRKRNTMFVKIFLAIPSTIMFSLILKKFTIPVTVNGVGFDDRYVDKNYKIPIGYMQSYRWLRNPDTKSSLMKVKPVEDDERINKYRLLSQLENPVVVHFRFGDYVGNDQFGRPHNNYYKVSLDLITKKTNNSKIWVFSDDIEKAKREFPENYKSSVRWIEDLGDSTAATFEVMRFGSFYVIANSTFSWWAAYLNYQQSPDVTVPSPWFKGMLDPRDLSPTEWIRIPSDQTH